MVPGVQREFKWRLNYNEGGGIAEDDFVEGFYLISQWTWKYTKSSYSI